MKRITKTKLFIMFSIIGLFQTSALQSKGIIDYFIDMPSYLLPSVESSCRLEMTENKLRNNTDTIQNKLGTTIRFIELDTLNQYIHIANSENSTFQLFTTTHGNDTVIGIINSVCAPICSSYSLFFNRNWEKQQFTVAPLQANDWLVKSDSLINGKPHLNQVLTSFIELKFNPLRKTIEAYNRSLDYIGLEDKAILEPYFSNKPIELIWDISTNSYQIKTN